MTGIRARPVRLAAGALTLGLVAVAAAVASGREDPASAGAPPETVCGKTAAVPYSGTAPDSAERFPHEAHAGLFPLCTGCHGGIGTGDSVAFYPDAESCAGCHDGEQEERVQWDGPRRDPSGLTFDHGEHAAEMRSEGEAEAACASCHTAAGATRMAVTGAAVPDRCLSCHEHEPREHYVDASCGTCHRPLAESGFDVRRIVELPEPAGHDADDFLIEAHGEAAEGGTASCQTCHTRERCTSCHVDGESRNAVAAVPTAPATMRLPGMAARYPTPESHESGGWLETHGRQASAAECATCHTRQSCTTCHRDAPPRAVARLPDGRHVPAPGVDPVRRAPASHRSPDFPTEHGDLAAADPGSCTSCHSESSCTDCHAGGVAAAAAGGRAGRGPSGAPNGGFGPVRSGGPGGPLPATTARGPRWREHSAAEHVPADTTRADTIEADTTDSDSVRSVWPAPRIRSEPGGFHPENFMDRHAAAAYGNRMECSSCHSTGAFCRDCHQQTGMGTSGRIEPGFHDAQPLWLLRHGQAARQALESCASCHRQTDCTQCHSTTGAFSVNPHGPNFDAERFAERNRQVCFACHLTDPLGGGPDR